MLTAALPVSAVTLRYTYNKSKCTVYTSLQEPPPPRQQSIRTPSSTAVSAQLPLRYERVYKRDERGVRLFSGRFAERTRPRLETANVYFSRRGATSVRAKMSQRMGQYIPILKKLLGWAIRRDAVT